MARCDRSDCGKGEIDDQGFCTACDRRQLAAPGPRPDPPPGSPPDPGRAAAPLRPEPWWGLGLVTVGDVPETLDELGDIDTPIAEDKRFCDDCAEPVGRRHDGTPGRVTGFCANCGSRFDFATRVGELVDGRYEIKGKLGAGSFGSAWLAYDRNLGTEVVLKDLTRSVAKTAEQERDALVGLRHDSIVRIYGYEPQGPYLVLEYVRGTPLSVRADDRLEVILAHGLQILQALDYLHARELLHIDVKPQNIIRFAEVGADGRARDRVRLIDFGSVWKLRDSGPVTSYTKRYAPPPADAEHALPTAGFDLFCLGETLRVLCGRHLREPGSAALSRLLTRATDTSTPNRRFTSARQFAEQLSGVIRQVVATSAGSSQVIRPSALFGAMSEPLDGALGEPRPVKHWVAARMRDDELVMPAPFRTPAAADVAAALPAPLADPDEPERTRTCRDLLAACRAAVRRGAAGEAAHILSQAALPGWFWIHAWYCGLVKLAAGSVNDAAGQFSVVRDALPGELIPQLALALCDEIRGERAQARANYEAVTGTAPALGAAAFGLARTHLLAGRRAAAVTAAGRLAAELRAQGLRNELQARIAVIRLRAAVTDSAVPAEADLDIAAELTGSLDATDATKLGLRAEIQYARSAITGDWLTLSGMIPELATLAVSKPEFFAMIDLSNRLRPPVEPWWRRARRRVS